jgi:radical SAM protein with 4Fe4S-binding SPASM domain
MHCGSRAGKTRANELDTNECLDIVEQLKALGTREITLIGGEAFLKEDWLKIVSKISQEGMDCSMQTGGYQLTEERIIAAKKAGIKNIGVSIDGLSPTHDEIRRKRGSFEHATECLRLLILINHKVKNWQIQLAVAIGNAVDNDALIIQPFEVKPLIDHLYKLFEIGLENDLIIQPGNNIGYFGPHEHLWRQGDSGHYSGCSAGHISMGIEADGTIKGCPSLPTKDYAGGNVRDLSLKELWETSEQLRFSRLRDTNELWGFCKTCYYASVCIGGCSWVSHSLFGRRGNNPFCYHRIGQLEKQGTRERIQKIREAAKKSFALGLYEIILEDLDGNFISKETPQDSGNQMTSTLDENRKITQLRVCQGCKNHIYQDTIICPFCNGNVEELEGEYNANLTDLWKAAQKVEELLARHS